MIVALIVLAIGTFAMKAIGPVVAAGRQLPPTAARLSTLLPAALLAALVATQTVGGPDGLDIDARIVGVGAAGLAVALKAPFGVVVLIGAAVTAGVRAIGWG